MLGRKQTSVLSILALFITLALARRVVPGRCCPAGSTDTDSRSASTGRNASRPCAMWSGGAGGRGRKGLRGLALARLVLAATRSTQISRGYQGVGAGFGAVRGVLLACLDHPLPLSGGVASHASEPRPQFWGGRVIREGLPGTLIRRRAAFPSRSRSRETKVAKGIPANGQCCRRRRPVGRRRERQDRRLVVGTGRHRRAIPGRPQRRPYVGHQRRNLQTRPIAIRGSAAL